jgi:hypothetical protein
MSLNVKMVAGGKEFWASARQANAIAILTEAQKGGFATIRGYVSTSDRVSPETANICALTRFNNDRLRARKLAALRDLKLADVQAKMVNPKLKVLTLGDLEQAFEERKAEMIATIEKTQSGDRSDAHRQAHDTFYVAIDDGVKCHFKTQKVGKVTSLVLVDGLPIVESIMLPYIEISKQVLVEGEYKQVNSGVPVLISNVIESVLPKSTKYKNLSLKEDNFESIAIGGDTLEARNIMGDYT